MVHLGWDYIGVFWWYIWSHNHAQCYWPLIWWGGGGGKKKVQLFWLFQRWSCARDHLPCRSSSTSDIALYPRIIPSHQSEGQRRVVRLEMTSTAVAIKMKWSNTVMAKCDHVCKMGIISWKTQEFTGAISCSAELCEVKDVYCVQKGGSERGVRVLAFSQWLERPESNLVLLWQAL